MIVRVQFRRRDGEGFAGSGRLYRCNIPDVKPGDRAWVSCSGTMRLVRVLAVDIAESRVEAGELARMKRISRLARTERA